LDGKESKKLNIQDFLRGDLLVVKKTQKQKIVLTVLKIQDQASTKARDHQTMSGEKSEMSGNNFWNQIEK
jgi:hypothetical protein